MLQLIGLAVGAAMQAYGASQKPDTVKPQPQCGVALNSGMVKSLGSQSLPPLTTKFRPGNKIKVNGKATKGRTWQECVLARSLMPGQIYAPMANPDMMDFLPGVADENGMIATANGTAGMMAAPPGALPAMAPADGVAAMVSTMPGNSAAPVAAPASVSLAGKANPLSGALAGLDINDLAIYGAAGVVALVVLWKVMK